MARELCRHTPEQRREVGRHHQSQWCGFRQALSGSKYGWAGGSITGLWRRVFVEKECKKESKMPRKERYETRILQLISINHSFLWRFGQEMTGIDIGQLVAQCSMGNVGLRKHRLGLQQGKVCVCRCWRQVPTNRVLSLPDCTIAHILCQTISVQFTSHGNSWLSSCTWHVMTRFSCAFLQWEYSILRTFHFIRCRTGVYMVFVVPFSSKSGWALLMLQKAGIPEVNGRLAMSLQQDVLAFNFLQLEEILKPLWLWLWFIATCTIEVIWPCLWRATGRFARTLRHADLLNDSNETASFLFWRNYWLTGKNWYALTPSDNRKSCFTAKMPALTCSWKVVHQHRVKVYAPGAPGAPPMSMPHLDYRTIGGKEGSRVGRNCPEALAWRLQWFLWLSILLVSFVILL